MNTKNFLNYFFLAALIAGVGFVIWYFFFSGSGYYEETVGEDITTIPQDTGMSIKTIGNVNTNVIAPPSPQGFGYYEDTNYNGNYPQEPVYVMPQDGGQITENMYG